MKLKNAPSGRMAWKTSFQLLTSPSPHPSLESLHSRPAFATAFTLPHHHQDSKAPDQ